MQNNQKQEEKTQFQKEIKDKQKISNFYFLLLIQILVIFISPFIFDDEMFFKIKIYNHASDVTFDEYCERSNKCLYLQVQDENYPHFYPGDWRADLKLIEQHDRRIFEELKATYDTKILILSERSYFSLTLYPLIMILQSIFKNFQILRKCQKILYVIQLQLLCIFVRVLVPTVKIRFYYSIKKQYHNYYVINVIMLFLILLLNIIILLINQQYFKYNLNLRNLTQPIVLFYFVVTFTQLFTNYFKISNFEWATLIGVMILIHLYFVLLNTYLFDENNKFTKQNKRLIAIVFRKINPVVDLEDALIELKEKYFIVSRKKAYALIFGFILLICFRDQIFQENVMLILGTLLLLLIWDTSLISTSSKFTMKDSYLAANLFFLDFFLPLRNIVQFLIV